MNMKRFFSFAIMLAAVIGFCACSADTPSDVVEDSFDCVIKGDFKGYFSNIYWGGKDAEEEKENFEAFWSRVTQGDDYDKMMEEWKNDEDKHNIKVEILSEEIDEEGDRATVKVNVKMGDRDKDRTIKLRKDAGGKWKLTRGLSEM